jgi:hypothetical protein
VRGVKVRSQLESAQKDSDRLAGENMVTVVMVEKRPSKLEQDEPRHAPRTAKPPAEGSAESVDPLSASDRYRRISLCAYFKAEQHGFESGRMWEDWLAAEREVDAGSGRRASGSDRK